MAERSMIAEFAAAGRVSPGTMAAQFAGAASLVSDFPATLRALSEGRDGEASAGDAGSLAGRASSFSRLFLDPSGMVTNVDADVPSGRTTSLCNLANFCTSHLPLKHPDVDERHRWTVRQDAQGVLVWRSPLGRHYMDSPEPRVMFV